MVYFYTQGRNMGQTKKVSSKKITWIDINYPTKKDLEFLESKFKVAPEHIQASLPSMHAQRPNVIVNSNYVFVVALFPTYNRESREIQSAEVDVFITKDHLITIHDQKIKMMNRFYTDVQTDEKEGNLELGEKPSDLFYDILDYLYHDLYPKLDNINKDIKKIEKNIFEGNDKEIIKEILVVKTNILNFKRIMQAHRSMIKKLLKIETKYLGSKNFVQLYYNELLDHVKDIWTIIETYGESIESLENTSNAIVDQTMNRIIYTLTILTVLLFPVTILGTIFGMNARNMPFIGDPNDFWIILGLMAFMTITLWATFKKKRWI